MKFSIILRLFFGLLLFSTIAYSHSNQEQSNPEHQEQTEVWTCPMHPQIRESKPGQCPICGMNLVKDQAKDNEGANKPNS